MVEFLNCAIYLVISGILIFLIGRIYPRKWILTDKFPFKSYGFEKEGKFYERFKIKKWKTKIPDASKILGRLFPWLMPTKRLEGNSSKKVGILIKETCVAEATHLFAAITGFFCIRIWQKSIYGILLSSVYALAHVPFIMVQRYNRPRLIKAIRAA